MDYISALGELKKGIIHPLYLVYGPEDLLAREFIAALRAKVLPTGDEWNYTHLDWPVSAREVVGLCATLPFLAARRMVVVEGATLFGPRRGKTAATEGSATAGDADEAADGGGPADDSGDGRGVAGGALPGEEGVWSAYFAAPGDSTVLVLLAGDNVDRRTRLYKQIDQCGRVVECAPPKRQRDVIAWLQARAADRGLRLSEDAAAQLAMSVAGGLRGLATELDKLATFVGAGGTIDRAVVAALVPRTAEVRIFDLIDAVAEGRQRQAIDLLSEALGQGEQPLRVTALLARQFRLAIQARVMVDDGANSARVAEQLGLHPFVAEKLVKQCRRFSRDGLCRALVLLLEADIAIKTGRCDPRLALEVLVIELMRLAR